MDHDDWGEDILKVNSRKELWSLNEENNFENFIVKCHVIMCKTIGQLRKGCRVRFHFQSMLA